MKVLLIGATGTIGVLGQEPIPGSTVISLANSGLEGFIRVSSLELQDIRINAVSPTFVKETMERMGAEVKVLSPCQRVN